MNTGSGYCMFSKTSRTLVMTYSLALMPFRWFGKAIFSWSRNISWLQRGLMEKSSRTLPTFRRSSHWRPRGVHWRRFSTTTTVLRTVLPLRLALGFEGENSSSDEQRIFEYNFVLQKLRAERNFRCFSDHISGNTNTNAPIRGCSLTDVTQSVVKIDRLQ